LRKIKEVLPRLGKNQAYPAFFNRFIHSKEVSMNAIDALDLEPIKVKLMHKESGEGWSLERANAIEFEYRRFLFLMKMFPAEQAAPLVDVDTFWHYHILDTMKYAADCGAVFGQFLHHFPYIGLRGEDDLAAHESMGLRMKELYEATFGEDYLRHTAGLQAAYSASPGATAYSASPAQAAMKTAYSASPVKFAYSASPVKFAYSASPGQLAQSLTGAAQAGAAIDKARLAGLYTDRPRLAPAA
jgi:hypothetical protein